MINKESKPAESEKVKTDTAKMDVNCHILIKDKDTNTILINKRG